MEICFKNTWHEDTQDFQLEKYDIKHIMYIPLVG
jgi:hypothetical protein